MGAFQPTLGFTGTPTYVVGLIAPSPRKEIDTSTAADTELKAVFPGMCTRIRRTTMDPG